MKIIDLAPKDRNDTAVYLRARAAVNIKATDTVSIIRSNYPPPPKGFSVSSDVKTLQERYEGYLDGKVPLLIMAYWCLTIIEANYGQGKRKTTGHTLNIDSEVLNTLGQLTPTRGDRMRARKASKSGKWKSLIGIERTWIESVIKRLIYRVGEYAGRDDKNTLTGINKHDFTQIQ